jgi:hypothetical protein
MLLLVSMMWGIVCLAAFVTARVVRVSVDSLQSRVDSQQSRVANLQSPISNL